MTRSDARLDGAGPLLLRASERVPGNRTAERRRLKVTGDR
jgi:hypothetical protein